MIAAFYTMIPITHVDGPIAFALKIIGVVVLANVLGVTLYLFRGKRT